MSSDNERTEESHEEKGKESSANEGGRVTDAKTSAEEYAGDNECPECGEPVNEVRANCPNCGYAYKDSDYTDKEAGSEFISGTAVDDEGNEIPDDETGGGGEEDSDAKDGSSESK